MKKIAILFFLGIIFSTGAMAQKSDVKKDETVLKNSVKDKKEDKHEAGNDLAHLRIKSAAKERREIRRHKKSIRRQGEHLEDHGVKHPVTKAKHQAKAEKEMKKGKE
ncbi:MAG: hypothetical protein Q8941_12455 [Bacteroidota bacterium]|nr:hypothetical protein [Bacteroidota bacterium]